MAIYFNDCIVCETKNSTQEKNSSDILKAISFRLAEINVINVINVIKEFKTI